MVGMDTFIFGRSLIGFDGAALGCFDVSHPSYSCIRVLHHVYSFIRNLKWG